MKIKRTGEQKPLAVLVYGPDGIGKTTMGSHFPKPIVLGPEIEGSDFIDGMYVDEDSKTFDGLMLGLNWLINNEHDYETLILDSLDHVEMQLHDAIKTKYKVSNLNKAAGGFGGGYKEAAQEQFSLKEKLMELRTKKKMNLFLIAHDQVKTFNSPLTDEPYDRHELKLHESSSVSPRGMWREAVDAVIFLNREFKTKGEGRAVRAKATEEIYAFTERSPAFDAKCRFEAPKSIEFDLNKNFYEILKGYAFSKNVDQYALALKLYKSLEKEDKAILKYIEENKDNKKELIDINNRLKEMV